MKNTIEISNLDYTRLNGLINNLKSSDKQKMDELTFLESEIARAKKVGPKRIKPQFVTMNSTVEVFDFDLKRMMKVKLVYPKEANFREGKISVLSPFGSALIGYKVGSIISFKVPKGIKKMRIDKIIYQPEASGEFSV